MKYTILTFVLLMFPLLFSCGKSNGDITVIHTGARDRIESAELVSIEDSLPIFHSGSGLLIIGDTLIIHDSKSTDLQFIAYDVVKDEYLGSFGKFGNGPGEIANYGGMYFDYDKRILYGQNLNQWNISGFELDSCIGDADYNAFVKLKYDSVEAKFPFMHGHHINDTLIYGSIYVPTEGTMQLESHIAKFNLENGKYEIIDKIGMDHAYRGKTLTLPERDLIVSAGRNFDRLRFFDMEGNLRMIVYGPDYEEKYNGRNLYFSDITTNGNELFCIYSVVDMRNPIKRNDILIYDLSGNYLKTLHFECPIVSLVYHDKSNRIYITTDDYPQIGYLELKDYI